MKSELMAAIRNALDRGYTIEEAMSSLINAGYGAEEVQEAAAGFSGASNIIYEKRDVSPFAPDKPNIQQESAAPQAPPQQVFNRPSSKPVEYMPKGKSKNLGLVIFLVAVLVLLAGILIASLLYKEQILTFLKGA